MSTSIVDSARPEVPSTVTRTIATRRRARRHKARIILIQCAVVIVFLAVWQFVSGRFIPDLLISSPSQVLPLFWTWLTDGTLAFNAMVTFQNAFLGLLVGGVLGIIVGIILGQSTVLAEIFEPFITALYTMPKHALIPLFIMWVGIGAMLGILTAAVIVFFLVFFNTFFGIKDVSQSLVNGVRVMGGSRMDVMFRVRLPSALIWVVAALKLAVPQAVVGVVVAEMLAGDSGLGYLVSRNAGMFNSAGTFAALLALLIAGFLIDRLMSWVTRKPLQWKNANGTS